jgi:hypothetical protein
VYNQPNDDDEIATAFSGSEEFLSAKADSLGICGHMRYVILSSKPNGSTPISS